MHKQVPNRQATPRNGNQSHTHLAHPNQDLAKRQGSKRATG